MTIAASGDVAHVGRRLRWLGRQDSNLGSRDQNPLPYRLATPHWTPSIGAARPPGDVRPAKRSRSVKSTIERGDRDQHDDADRDEPLGDGEHDRDAAARRSWEAAKIQRRWRARLDS